MDPPRGREWASEWVSELVSEWVSESVTYCVCYIIIGISRARSNDSHHINEDVCNCQIQTHIRLEVWRWGRIKLVRVLGHFPSSASLKFEKVVLCGFTCWQKQSQSVRGRIFLTDTRMERSKYTSVSYLTFSFMWKNALNRDTVHSSMAFCADALYTAQQNRLLRVYAVECLPEIAQFRSFVSPNVHSFCYLTIKYIFSIKIAVI
jgi:hypothetical protein